MAPKKKYNVTLDDRHVLTLLREISHDDTKWICGLYGAKLVGISTVGPTYKPSREVTYRFRTKT